MLWSQTEGLSSAADNRDELWKQLRQSACFLSCSGHLQLHYMLTYCKWHCATHLWDRTEYTGRWSQLCPRSYLPPPMTSKNLNAAQCFHLNRSLTLSQEKRLAALVTSHHLFQDFSQSTASPVCSKAGALRQVRSRVFSFSSPVPDG